MSKLPHLALASVATALLGLGCATNSVPFLAAPTLPAASGVAKVRPERNGNALVKLDVEHLAQPGRLMPPRGMYCLWAQNPDGKNALLGRLQIDDQLEVSWKGSVPFDNFRLVITAEDFAAPHEPSTPEILVSEFVKVEPKRWYQF